ncbi:ATP-binding protein [Natrinema sp. SYSU A 869]|uniref:ATP-binding protein n=1 Tax=Natrinema sp. SYSU A 869 TaxID=2871694 RepID=UPI002105F1B4|nr:ATP-binding protein [Natrinema sp. SYSU A 869]
MYASSFILTLGRIDATLDRALDLETFARIGRAVRIADDAIAAIEDVGELASVALSQVTLSGLERTPGDDAITEIVWARFDGGFDADLATDTVDRARDAGRIDEIADDVLVPVGESMPDVRNWWVLAGVLTDRLEALVDGFSRVHERAAIDAPDRIETVFWTVAERLAALADAIADALVIGQFTRRSVRQGSFQLLEGAGRLATAVAGGEMLNLKPVALSGQPTSHVKIGASKVGGSTDLVEVKHANRRAYFYVKPVDDRLVDDIGTDIRLHENVEELFGGFDRGRDCLADPDVNPAAIPDCESVSIHTAMDDESLDTFLRETNYLLHPIEEVVMRGDDTELFEPVDLEPSGYSTVRVTADTDIEFVDTGEYRELKATADARPGEPIGVEPERGDQQPADDEAIEVSIEPKQPTVSFEEDVAGLPEVKRTAENLLALFDPDVRDEVIDRYGDEFASRGNSMLLYGPPGCGKTLISEAIAYEAKFNSSIEDSYGEVKFLEIKGSDVLSKYSGESEKRVEAIFEKAHGIAQDGFAVLFFDEVDTLIPDRGDDSLQRHERSLTNAFLQEMNEIEDNLLVIGATNMPFTIDPAATRRFPIQQFIPQPDEEVMAEVWQKHLSAMTGTAAIEYERIGAESRGYTPAEIADRVLGSELQRELVESVHLPDREPIEPDTDYFLERLDETEPKTIRQYVASVRTQIDDLEGYPELKRYVEEQTERLGMRLGTESPSLEGLLGDETGLDSAETNETETDSAETDPNADSSGGADDE